MSMRVRLSGGLGQLGVGLQVPFGTNSLGAVDTVDGRLMAAGDRQSSGQKGVGNGETPPSSRGQPEAWGLAAISADRSQNLWCFF